jgi:hypothetical protein
MKEGEEEPMLAALWPSMVFETVDIEHISAMMAGGVVHLNLLEQKHHHFISESQQKFKSPALMNLPQRLASSF